MLHDEFHASFVKLLLYLLTWPGHRKHPVYTEWGLNAFFNILQGIKYLRGQIFSISSGLLE